MVTIDDRITTKRPTPLTLKNEKTQQ